MARVIEDGPGYRYLRATCPENGFTVCAYLDRLPVHANMFLWDSSLRGVFSAVPLPARRALAAEQPRFVIAVLAHAPWAELRAALRDADAARVVTFAVAQEAGGQCRKAPHELMSQVRKLLETSRGNRSRPRPHVGPEAV